MPSVEILDDVVVALPRDIVARRVAQPARWAAWWPELEVTLVADRGVEGMTWSLAGPLVGWSEVTLAAEGAGVRIHYVLRADPSVPGSRREARQLSASPYGQRHLADMRRRQLIAWQRTVWALVDELES